MLPEDDRQSLGGLVFSSSLILEQKAQPDERDSRWVVGGAQDWNLWYWNLWRLDSAPGLPARKQEEATGTPLPACSHGG